MKQHVSFQIKDSMIVFLNEIDIKAYEEGIATLKYSQKEKAEGQKDPELSEFQIARAIEQMKNTVQPEIVAVLELLNTKLNLLNIRLQITENHHAEFNGQEPQLVSVSTAGMSLGSKVPVEKNKALQIKLVLLPQYSEIPIFGEVIECTQDEESFPPFPYKLLVKFDFMLEEDTDKLIQHMLRKQSEHLRKKRLGGHEGVA